MTDLRDATVTTPAPAADSTSASGSTSFASASLAQHLLRGAVGFGGLIGAAVLVPVLGWGSLVLAPVGLLALRGCPLCWTIGLVQTVSMGRLQRSCTEGRCELTVAVPSTAGTTASLTTIETPTQPSGPTPTRRGE
ncbi:hypothetical protein [Streptomyces albipurpureus]|uniref:DUF2892 domain-containing protein n=1 Tax=Streptomyces albipurpureus TaxID=2897419 RepID=A0ABT0UX84_9ACTN|nr:hypothetical protein [Streptomyces sp. CWNU-1]MCM2392559.1 hypothetical protein [Streptomyces sp. CWNU-1]